MSRHTTSEKKRRPPQRRIVGPGRFPNSRPPRAKSPISQLLRTFVLLPSLTAETAIQAASSTSFQPSTPFKIQEMLPSRRQIESARQQGRRSEQTLLSRVENCRENRNAVACWRNSSTQIPSAHFGREQGSGRAFRNCKSNGTLEGVGSLVVQAKESDSVTLYKLMNNESKG